MNLAPEWRALLQLIPGYDSEATADPTDVFDTAAAQLALDFFPECLQFIEGERGGTPFVLEPWQQAIVAALWGWKRADGTRRYRECLIYVPRKNGKTPFCAGLVLLSMFTDHEPGAQLYAAAADRNQAAIIFRHASEMILREPMMASRARVYRSFKSIESTDGAIFRALSSESDTKHGLGGSLIVIDELHAHPNADLVEVLRTSTGARRNPLVLYITTADYDRPSICNVTHDHATRVRDGVIQDRAFLPVIYEAGPDDDWTDPAVWAKANPNLGVSIKADYLARECLRAQSEPTYENTFRRLHLNQKTSQDTRFISLTDWDKCEADRPNLDGRPCYAGLDLSTTTDITAFVLVFPPLEDEPLFVLPFFWVPESKLRNSRDRVPYDVWQRDGYVTTTPGDVIDYDHVRAAINALARQYDIRSIAYDPYNATQIATQLAEQDGLDLVQHRQGFVSMNEPTKELERLVISQGINHDDNPVMRWMLGAVAVKMDESGNIKPDKKKSTQRIDGVVALIMALSAVMHSDCGSVYDERDLIVL